MEMEWFVIKIITKNMHSCVKKTVEKPVKGSKQ